MLPIAAAACVSAKKKMRWDHPVEMASAVIALATCAAAFFISNRFLAQPSVRSSSRSKSKVRGGVEQEAKREKQYVYENWRRCGSVDSRSCELSTPSRCRLPQFWPLRVLIVSAGFALLPS
jgi:hypothetical protein